MHYIIKFLGTGGVKKVQIMKKRSMNNTMGRYLALFVLLVALLTFFQSQVALLSESLSGVHNFSGSYDSSDQTGPVKIPAIKTSDVGVLKMKFNFTPSESTAEWPNLFQTSDVNYGIRAEIRNGAVQGGANTLGIVYAKSEAGDLEGVSMSENFQFGIQHELSIEAKRKEYIVASLDGVRVERREPLPNFKTDNILVGQGFNPDRAFSGVISRYEIKYIENQKQAQTYYFVLNGLLMALMLLLLRKDIRKMVLKRD